MKLISKSMALCAVGLLFFVPGIMGMTGCGATVYESVAEPAPKPQAEAVSSLPEPDGETHSPAAPGESAGGMECAESLPQIYVYVCGAVFHPGVYELPGGARVYEALAAAGGLKEEADLRALNQAAPLSDGQQLTVLTYEETELTGGRNICGNETAAASGVPVSGTGTDGKIDINTADAAELMQLKGIGEKRAKDIIAYREAHGPFAAVEGIMNVRGIKSALFEQIREEIIASG